MDGKKEGADKLWTHKNTRGEFRRRIGTVKNRYKRKEKKRKKSVVRWEDHKKKTSEKRRGKTSPKNPQKKIG